MKLFIRKRVISTVYRNIETALKTQLNSQKKHLNYMLTHNRNACSVVFDHKVITYKQKEITMKNTKPFAFAAANKNTVKQDKKWKATDKAATAGCSGPWARADTRWARDNGIWC